MLLDICLGTRTSWKILLVLSEAPGKAVGRKEIRALTGLGNKVITKFLLVLENFDLIISNKIGKTHYYKLNMSTPFAGKILELIQIEKRNLNNPDFFTLNVLRDFVYELTNTNLGNLSKVILFGSYAKRTYTAASDIDVAIILREKSNDDELLITQITDKLNKRYKKEIQPHYYTIKGFEEEKKKNKLAEEIAKDGIVLM